MNKTPPYPALFLDRDGVINIDEGYINDVSKIIFNDEIFEIGRFFKQKNFKIIIVTNQSGIGRNFISMDEYVGINSFIQNKFEYENCSIDLILTASVNPDDSNASADEIFLRKPNPGMILRAQSSLNLNLSKSLLIGDNLSDMQAGKAAGVSKLFLIKNPPIPSDYFESCSSLKECLLRLRGGFNF